MRFLILFLLSWKLTYSLLKSAAPLSFSNPFAVITLRLSSYPIGPFISWNVTRLRFHLSHSDSILAYSTRPSLQAILPSNTRTGVSLLSSIRYKILSCNSTKAIIVAYRASRNLAPGKSFLHNF